jgi:hypothetical protein
VPPPAIFSGRVPAGPESTRHSADLIEPVADSIDERLRRGLALPLPPAARGAVGPAKRIGLAVYSPGPHPVTRYWRVDLDRRESAAREFASETGTPQVDWLVTGEVRSWLSVLSGEKNIATCIRERSLRHIDFARPEQETIAAGTRRARSYPAILNHLLELAEPLSARVTIG